MLSSFPIAALMGTTLGFLAGLGIGGGSLLILWLTVVLKIPYTEGRMINLLFFLPASLICCFFRWKQGSISLKTIFPAIISGCIAAAAGAWLGTALDMTLLKKGFGILLILTGLRELRYKPKKEEP